jgi:hypothetical protein
LTQAVDADLGGLLKLLGLLQKRATERHVKNDLQTIKDVLEAW